MNITTHAANNSTYIAQSTATATTTNEHITDLFNYLSTNPDAKVKFRVLDVRLKIHSNRACLSAAKS